MEKEKISPIKTLKHEEKENITMPKRKKVSFYVKPKGSKKRKKVTFYARR